MDMMFLYLFSTDMEFLKLFLNEANVTCESAEVISVELSKTDPKYGESDITVIVKTDKQKIALLIEDKIDAIAMPEQPERYLRRGRIGVKKGEYDRYKNFIVCPQKYYENNEIATHYPFVVTYETIRDYIAQVDSQLYRVYHQQITQSINKAKKHQQIIIDEKANAFFRQYKDYQEANYPNLDLRTKRGSNGYWALYATRLGNVYIHHKIKNGKVDLTFNNAATRMAELTQVVEWLRNHNINGIRAVVAGKSGVIHANVPPLDMTIPFDDNSEKDICKCFMAIAEMTEIANIFALANSLGESKD